MNNWSSVINCLRSSIIVIMKFHNWNYEAPKYLRNYGVSPPNAPKSLYEHWDICMAIDLHTATYRFRIDGHCNLFKEECTLCKEKHYNDVIMSTIASQITSFTIVYSTVYSGADQRKHESSASLAFFAGNSLGTGEFPAQMVSNAENVSIWWRHHGMEWQCGGFLALVEWSGGLPVKLSILLVYHTDGFSIITFVGLRIDVSMITQWQR